jgi:hypothetical protein
VVVVVRVVDLRDRGREAVVVVVVVCCVDGTLAVTVVLSDGGTDGVTPDPDPDPGADPDPDPDPDPEPEPDDPVPVVKFPSDVPA